MGEAMLRTWASIDLALKFGGGERERARAHERESARAREIERARESCIRNNIHN